MKPLAVMLFIVLVAIGCTVWQVAAEPLNCVLLRKQMREIAWNDADAFDMRHLGEVGEYKYMCDLSEFTVMDWDWIEWGVRLNKVCEQYRKECRGPK